MIYACSLLTARIYCMLLIVNGLWSILYLSYVDAILNMEEKS